MNEASPGTLQGIWVKRDQAAQVRYAGLGVGVAAAVFAGSVDVLPWSHVASLTLTSLLLAAVTFAADVAARFRSRREHLLALALAIHLVEIPAYTWMIHLCGGIEVGYLTLIYAAVILVSGISGPPFVAWGVALYSGLCYGLLAYLEYVGVIPHHHVLFTQRVPGHIQATTVLVIVALLLFFGGMTAATSKRLRRSRRLLRQKARELGQEVRDRRQAETDALQTKMQLEAIVQQATDVIFMKDRRGRYELMNPAGAALFGRLSGEIVGSSDPELFGPRDSEEIREIDAEILRKGQPLTYERRRRFGDDERILQVTKIPHLDAEGDVVGIIGIGRDVTEDRRNQERLEKALEEQQGLIREIHHRVKNNLQVVSSLLRMQARSVPNEEARRALLESQRRIRSMALVHELLYRELEHGSIRVDDYLARLVDELQHIYAAAPKLEMGACGDSLVLGLETAIFCGLIVSELVANSFHHAFPEGRPGKIEVGIRRVPEEDLELWVADDGIGMPETPRPGSIGLGLVRGFARQIRGELEWGSGPGTRIAVRFPDRQETPGSDSPY